MLNRLFQIAVCLLLFGAFSPAAQSQELPSPFTIEGSWWCRDNGGKNIMKLNIGSIAAGVAPVSGGGVSRNFERAFLIRTATTQNLQFDSSRNFFGGFAIQDMAREGDIGSLVVNRGRLNRTKTKMQLRCTLTIGDAPGRKVRLVCERLDGARPDWQGRSTDGRMRGTGLKSDKYDIQLTENPVLGFPFFSLLSGGPVRIDGTESPDVSIIGVVGVTSRGQIAAELFSEQFGAGVARGRIRSPKFEGARPTLTLQGSTDSRPRVRTRSTLLRLTN